MTENCLLLGVLLAGCVAVGFALAFRHRRLYEQAFASLQGRGFNLKDLAPTALARQSSVLYMAKLRRLQNQYGEHLTDTERRCLVRSEAYYHAQVGVLIVVVILGYVLWDPCWLA